MCGGGLIDPPGSSLDFPRRDFQQQAAISRHT
jgi:hypothetical protein